MYLECLLISRQKTHADEQTIKIKNQLPFQSSSEIYRSKQYRTHIRANPNFIDSGLSEQARANNTQLKKAVEKHEVECVLVSPLAADIQTCLDLFGENEQVSIVVEPLLVPRINSLANISKGNPAQLQKFKMKPSLIRLQAHPKWYITFAKSSKGSGSTFDDCVSEISKDEEYQTEAHFHERLSEVRKDLLIHVGPKKLKIGVIAHRQVLEALTSTGHYEDFKLINSVPFSYGEVKSEFVWIEGIEGELQSSGIPFCS